MVIWMSWKNWRAYLLGFSTGPIFSDRTGPGPDRDRTGLESDLDRTMKFKSSFRSEQCETGPQTYVGPDRLRTLKCHTGPWTSPET